MDIAFLVIKLIVDILVFKACLAMSKACLTDSWVLEGGTDVRTDGRTDGRTDVRKISPFYRTLSPIRGAAPLQPNFNPKTV